MMQLHKSLISVKILLLSIALIDPNSTQKTSIFESIYTSASPKGVNLYWPHNSIMIVLSTI